MAHPTTHVDRRRFLITAAASGCTAVARTAWATTIQSHQSFAYLLVATTDRDRILKAAAAYLTQSPITITAFPATRSAGGRHDFYSQADYFWPNPKDPNGPYINRDGQSNPNNFDDHRRVMVRLSIQMPALTAAWLLTGNRKYARRACDHLRAWFVAADTRMNPNLEFAQAVEGVSTGRSYGIIDSLHLVEVARAASFLTEKVLSPTDANAIRDWFSIYLDWLSTSAPGKTERDARNNHAMCWALQAAEYARLAGDDAARKEVFRRYREILLPDQMAADGSFPRELTRTKPYSYSIFNFDIMAGLCQSLKGLAPDPPTFQLSDGRGLARAAQFIYPYLKDKSSWKWAKDIEHFDALPVRSPGLLFSGIAFHEQKYIDLWKTLNPDPTDKEIIRNYPIRQPLLWV
ncbi:MAG TPA: alginate lyase family protein [Terracidiphilus sp.]|nr:alginate lyase family protein [Terracidiphilus sp.]